MLRTRQAARHAYDRLSSWYDWLAGSEEHFTRLALELLKVQPGEKVLEIGFGTGKSLTTLAGRCGAAGLVYGLDISRGMLDIARRRLNRANLAGQVGLFIGDGAVLPYTRSCFDAVFLAFTLELFDTPEIPLVLAECRRVLLPGGRLGVVAMAQPVHSSAIVSLYEWFHHRFPTLADCRPIPAADYISQAGFKIITSRTGSMWGLPVSILITKASS